jgi:hypothetical protein
VNQILGRTQVNKSEIVLTHCSNYNYNQIQTMFPIDLRAENLLRIFHCLVLK